MGNEALLPLVNPNVASMPLGFAGAVLGTLLGGVTEHSRRDSTKSPSGLRPP